ncbi:FAD/NAD(P)-binding protein [Kitasatospora purpeofusca]|uniref:FAD/NAD(P)-binding protein n=1 Tax=Kitasatospora purpeofusca TaxID=67352 RepID=UPI00386AAD9B|nr:FAD/NAD(P)-binding protein [Kitasatospora purpeofusca]
MTENPRRVAVVGAGASGALTAAQLLRRAALAGVPLDVRLIDRAPAPGRGAAYATTADHHLLNVPAGRMSAFADAPDDFVHWLARRAPGVHTAADHVPRRLYGAYLGEVLATAEARAGAARLHRVDDRVVSARRAGPGMSLRLGTGRRLDADAVVLALGTFPPDNAWAPARLRRSPRFVADPWAPGALRGLPEHQDLLLLGTGLTMIDVALVLARPGRRVHAVSRHGLVPRPHTATALPPARPPQVDPAAGLPRVRRALLAHVSACRRTHGDWRVGIDSLRPVTAALWQGLSPADRTRFQTEDRRLWDVHRHRAAPATARAFAAAVAEGWITVGPGELADAAPTGAGVRVRLRDGRALTVGAVLNCTGPQTDVRRVPDPLVAVLLGAGLAEPDDLGQGFRTDALGRVRPADDSPPAPLWTLGALRRGSLLESTAIPEIRAQAGEVAGDILADAG